MQFIDLKAQYQLIQDDLQQRMARVFEHGQYVMGPEVYALEEQLANYIGVKHGITVASGTDALLIAVMALGIGPGDEVITTPFSFIATAEVLLMVGAKPVFVDIDPRTYNIDARAIERAITPRTKAIMPVDLYGQCADYDLIQAIASKHNLAIIEDAAQSFGAEYKGRKAGTFGTISCTSFFPSKPLGCYGEGGACFTDNDELAAICRQIRNHGQDRRYHHVRLGFNGRMATLQAVVLQSQMQLFSHELALRQEVARAYDELLRGWVTTARVEPHNYSAYAQYTIEVENRDHVIQALEAEKIPYAIHYPVAIHQQPVMQDYGLECTSFPYAEYAAQHVLSLPFHPYLNPEEIKRVAEAIIQAVGDSGHFKARAAAC